MAQSTEYWRNEGTRKAKVRSHVRIEKGDGDGEERLTCPFQLLVAPISLLSISAISVGICFTEGKESEGRERGQPLAM